MQRDNEQLDNEQQGFVGRKLDHYVDDELCALDVFPGALCICRGAPRRNPLIR